LSHNSPQSLILIIESSPKPRLFALIIGINYYDNLWSLRGAAADALAVKSYLENSLRVPSGQIHMLLNKSASRAAIIRAFFNLRDDGRIEEGDPILIYYTGHGGQIASPEGEVGSKLQALLPQDYCERLVPPILNRTIGALIAQIAEKKGDNIVSLIFEFSR
jgi:Caspase domain